jgi:hypothetical protein
MRKLRADFRKEAKQERLVFKESLGQEWHIAYPSRENKENPGSSNAADYEDDEYAFDLFVSERMQSHDRWAAAKKATFLAYLLTQLTPILDSSDLSVRVRQERVQALWEGLRRVYFGEVEAPAASWVRGWSSPRHSCLLALSFSLLLAIRLGLTLNLNLNPNP